MTSGLTGTSGGYAAMVTEASRCTSPYLYVRVTRVWPGLAATASSIRQDPLTDGAAELTETLKIELSRLEMATFILRQSEKGKRDVFESGESLEKE